jgi:hypothetical protein
VRIGIEVVWWIGLIGALPATAVILKQAFLVIDALRRIHQLAEQTHVAAQGIVVHTLPVSQLEGAGDIVKRLDDVVGEVAKALFGIAGRLEGATRLQ